MKKAKTQMKILGVRDAQGNKIDLSNLGKAKRHIALHFTPKAIVQNVQSILEDLTNEKAPEELINLYTDILALVSWAESKLPLVPPPTKTE